MNNEQGTGLPGRQRQGFLKGEVQNSQIDIPCYLFEIQLFFLNLLTNF
jgi:hypothetical protein